MPRRIVKLKHGPKFATGKIKPPKGQQAAIPTQREVALRAFERMKRRLPSEGHKKK